MDERPLELSDVLHTLKRADIALTEFVAPLWPGVLRAAAWLEGKPRLFRIPQVPETEGFYYLATEGDVATVLRPAEPDETRRFLDFLPSALVILLCDGLAFPATFAERLHGITGPRPIRFATGEPLTRVQARYDGITLLYDGVATPAASPLGGLFAGSSIFAPGELLGVPGGESANQEAQAVLAELHATPTAPVEARLRAILATGGAELVAWHAEADGTLTLTWRRRQHEYTAHMARAEAPITAGISLPGARHFDPAALTRLLVEHALDAWE